MWLLTMHAIPGSVKSGLAIAIGSSLKDMIRLAIIYPFSIISRYSHFGKEGGGRVRFQ